MRQSVVAFDLVEDAHQPRRSDRRVDLDVQRFAVEVVDHVERAETASAGECVAHEINRPHRIGQPWYVQRHAFTLGQAAPGGPPEVELHGLVHPVDPFGVPVRPRLAQLGTALPEAAARPILDQASQGSDEFGIAHCPIQRRAVVRGTRQSDALAGPA